MPLSRLALVGAHRACREAPRLAVNHKGCGVLRQLDLAMDCEKQLVSFRCLYDKAAFLPQSVVGGCLWGATDGASAPLEGFEPTANCLEGSCSVH